MAKRKLPQLKPLKITCKSTDCDNGLHCFNLTVKMRRTLPDGACRECGAQVVDWERIHRRDFADVEYIISALNHECIRNHYWFKDLDPHAINYARRKGRRGLPTAIERRLRSSIQIKGPRDGRQTPKEGNPIYYAQHALACCCRQCIAYWWDVPEEGDLPDEVLQFFVSLCSEYIIRRIPDLTEAGIHVPCIRSKNKGS